MLENAHLHRRCGARLSALPPVLAAHHGFTFDDGAVTVSLEELIPLSRRNFDVSARHDRDNAHGSLAHNIYFHPEICSDCDALAVFRRQHIDRNDFLNAAI